MDILIIALSAFSVLLTLICLVFIFILINKIKFISAKDETLKLNKDISEQLRNTRIEINERIDAMQKNISASVADGLQNGNKLQLNATIKLSQEIQNTLNSFAQSVSTMQKIIENQMSSLQNDNNRKLDEMRLIVEDKLQKTLNERITESFKIVSSRLEQVYKGLGEMQTLASGVGDLKKILSNVKTRGVFGEIQLSRILEQLMTSEQYACNAVTKKGSSERVEFAIKLPGKSDEAVFLPIDAKFPMDLYNNLIDASNKGDKFLSEQAEKALENAIKKNARDIRDKYIDPPNTTDFGIMFLPTEGLYAEVVRNGSLLETVARDYNINIAGPSTISALINSLQMGFRTLAIEKHSHEVQKLLISVKTEFSKFEDALNSVKKRIDAAGNELENLVGARTRAMMRSLKSIEDTPEKELLDNTENSLK